MPGGLWGLLEGRFEDLQLFGLHCVLWPSPFPPHAVFKILEGKTKMLQEKGHVQIDIYAIR